MTTEHNHDHPAGVSIDEILTERGNRYGEFMTVAAFSQDLKNLFASAEPFLPLDPDMKEALDMAANKIARILCGDPTYADSWLDASGYFKLVADRLSGVVR